MGLPPTPARGFHPEPHNAHALFVLRLWRLETHVLNRRKATLSREHKSLSINPTHKQRQAPLERNNLIVGVVFVLKTRPHTQDESSSR
ncbi:MAG: hypothetical protein CL920_01340 [Deltaproteobacteria bacterium]|nr:hypothetical protein [Deltaproteobacteria bacterium]MBU47325.1 hypothetical protein [Deltaproteobacteria bacterium]